MARKKRKSTRAVVKRRVREPKPMKIAALIVSAIQDLRETKGSTPNKIASYISYSSKMPEWRVKRQVKTVLKKGVEYGILRRHRGQYFLPTGDELELANRIATRFSRVAVPAHAIKSSSIFIRRLLPLNSHKKTKRYGLKKRKPKRLTKVHRSTLLTPTGSSTDKICCETKDSSDITDHV